MRPIELLLAISAIFTLLWVSFSSSLPAPLAYILPLLSVVLAILQMAVEGYRWHLIPLYALALLLLLCLSAPFVQEFRSRLTYLVAAWALALLLAGSSAVLAGIVFPVFAFVPVTGLYRVGTDSLHLTDQSRSDPYAGQASHARELMVQFWYPAEQVGGLPRAKYRDGRAEGWSESSLAQVRTRAYFKAPVARAKEPFPVLLFSGPINRFQNTYETEELASHGYVVIGIDHPYDSDLVTFPDGRRIRVRKANTFLDFTSEASYESSRRDVESDLLIRAKDVEFVLNQLTIWDADPANRFYRRLSPQQVGMFGHSFGGAVTAEICRRDSRVLAGINMDGWMFGESGRWGVPKAFFFMTDDVPRPSETELHIAEGEARRVAERVALGFQEIDRSMARYGGYYLEVPGLQHMNYSDLPLYSRVKARTGAGSVDLRRTHDMVNAVSLAFFDRYVKGEVDSSVATVVARYPEAAFREATARPPVEKSDVEGALVPGR